MPLGKILLIGILFCAGFAAIAVSVTMMLLETPRNAESTEISVTTTEPLRDIQTDPLNDAQMEFNAGRLIESLEILMAFQPKETGQNRLQYKAAYYAFGPDNRYVLEFKDANDVTNNPEENNFYLKDELLLQLLDVFLKSRQSPLAVVAAQHVGHNESRNHAISRIVKAQIKASQTAEHKSPTSIDSVDEMINKAIMTASFLDNDRAKNEIYALIVKRLAWTGRFLNAVKLTERIPDRRTREVLLLNLMGMYSHVENRYKNSDSFKVDDQEASLKAILERIDDPGHKCRVLHHLAMLYINGNDQMEKSPSKGKETLDAILDTFKTVETSDNVLGTLARTVWNYRYLEMEEKAEEVEELVLSHVLNLPSPPYKYDIYCQLIGYVRGPTTADLQEKRDGLIRLAFAATLEMESNHVNSRISLLERYPSQELYHEIHTSLLASKLTVGEMIRLADHYAKRYQRPEFSQQEQLDGFKNKFVPLVADIYSNPKSSQSEHYRCSSYLAEWLLFLQRNGRNDEMIELINFLDVPQPLFDDAIFRVAKSNIHPCSLEDVERIENVFLRRITDVAKKMELRSDLHGRFGSKIGDRLNWDDYFKSARSEPDENKRFDNYYRIVSRFVPEEKDVTPFLDEMKFLAQGEEGTNIHVRRSIRLLELPSRLNFMPEEERLQLQQKIERVIEQIVDPDKKFWDKMILSKVLISRRQLPEEGTRLKYLTQLLDLARVIPEPARRLYAYQWTARFAADVAMPEFAGKVADEGLAFGETLPDQGRKPLQVLNPMNQLLAIKKELSGE